MKKPSGVAGRNDTRIALSELLEEQGVITDLCEKIVV